jgi:hypothetical protein
VAKNAAEQFKNESRDAFFKAFGTVPEFYEVNIGDGAGEVSDC